MSDRCGNFLSLWRKVYFPVAIDSLSVLMEPCTLRMATIILFGNSLSMANFSYIETISN
jgi:hypothetical protein